MPNQQPLTFFLSNKIALLLKELDMNLLINATPFSKRWIIVPNQEIGLWIQNQIGFSIQRQISMGTLCISSLEVFLDKLNHYLFPTEPLKIPDEVGIFFAVKKILLKTLSDERYNPIKKIFSTKTQRLSFSTVNFITAFIKKAYFMDFKIFEDMDPVIVQVLSEFQKIFDSLSEILNLFTQKIIMSPDNVPALHFFGFSDFSNPIKNFFHKIQNHIPINIYQQTACRGICLEVCSDKELALLGIPEAEQEKFHAIPYPFLGNWGEITKKLLCHICDYNLNTKENYEDNVVINDLNRLQNAILNVTEICPQINDDSFSIFKATSKLREIEILCDKILKIIGLENENAPSQIFVLTTNPQEYFPLITQVFSEKLSFKFSGFLTREGKNLKEKTELIFKIIESDLEIENLLLLVLHPDFLKKRRWKISESNFLLKILKNANILWKYTSNNQDTAWTDYIADIFRNYPFVSDISNEQSLFESSQSEIYGELGILLHNLTIFSSFMKLNHIPADYKDKMLHLLNICFYIDENEERILQEAVLNSFKKDYINTYEIDFDFFKSYFLKAIEHDFSNFRSHIGNFIRIGHLTHLSALPKDYTFILGFPDITWTSNPFDSLKTTSLQAEAETKLALLHAIISTKKKVCVSYTQNTQRSHESLAILQEMLKVVPKDKIENHPTQNYHPDYFKQSSPIFINDLSRFQMAENFNSSSPTIRKDFFSENHSYERVHENNIVTSERLISFVDLINCLSSPINHFFKHRYGINYKDHYPSIPTPKFYPSSAFKRKIKKQYLKERDPPLSPCLCVYSKSFFEEQAESEKNILDKFLNDSSLPYRTVVFSEAAVKQNSIIKTQNPPIEIILNGEKIKICGEIKGISSEGLYYPGKLKSKDLYPIQEYIEIIILRFLKISKGSLFFKDESESLTLTELSLTPEDARIKLENIVRYYYLTKNHPSPLLIEWVPAILSGDEEKLTKTIHDYIDRLRCDDLNFWILNFRQYPSATQILQYWKQTAFDIFNLVP
ncbi:MAG: hypothetical protein RSB82_00685 [Victivallaceae bacterium]